MKKEQGPIWCFFSKCCFCLYMTNLTLCPYFWGYKNFINIFKKLIKNCYPKTTFIFLISCQIKEKKEEIYLKFLLSAKNTQKIFLVLRGAKKAKFKNPATLCLINLAIFYCPKKFWKSDHHRYAFGGWC